MGRRRVVRVRRRASYSSEGTSLIYLSRGVDEYSHLRSMKKKELVEYAKKLEEKTWS